FDGAKRELVPGNFILGKQPGFEALRSRIEVGAEHPRLEEEMHLLDMWHIEHREEFAEFDARTGFFGSLALGAGAGGFAVLHEAGRQRPVPVARLDRPPAQQHPSFPGRNRADDEIRVLVVDRAAAVAAVAFTVVAGWYGEVNFPGTDGAIFHGPDRNRRRASLAATTSTQTNRLPAQCRPCIVCPFGRGVEQFGSSSGS